MNFSAKGDNAILHNQTASSNIHGKLFPSLNGSSSQESAARPDPKLMTEEVRNQLLTALNISVSAEARLSQTLESRLLDQIGIQQSSNLLESGVLGIQVNPSNQILRNELNPVQRNELNAIQINESHQIPKHGSNPVSKNGFNQTQVGKSGPLITDDSRENGSVQPDFGSNRGEFSAVPGKSGRYFLRGHTKQSALINPEEQSQLKLQKIIEPELQKPIEPELQKPIEPELQKPIEPELQKFESKPSKRAELITLKQVDHIPETQIEPEPTSTVESDPRVELISLKWVDLGPGNQLESEPLKRVDLDSIGQVNVEHEYIPSSAELTMLCYLNGENSAITSACVPLIVQQEKIAQAKAKLGVGAYHATEDDILRSEDLTGSKIRAFDQNLITAASLDESEFPVPAYMKEEAFPIFNVDSIFSKTVDMFVPDIEFDQDGKLSYPVDLCTTKKYVFVSSQATNQVVCFQQGKYIGTLKRDTSRYFNSPRNILGVAGLMKDPEEQTVLVLDNVGLHAYQQNGEFLKSLLTAEGYKYRGLDYFDCYKDRQNPKMHLVLTDVSGCVERKGVSVVVFTKDQSTMDIKQEYSITIESTVNVVTDPMCRFVCVQSVCDAVNGCKTHDAFVTGMKSKTVYKIDLKSRTCVEFNPFGSEPPNQTFADANELDPQVTLLEPTGICVGDLGNILVADKEGYKVLVFAPNGLLIKTFKMACQPLGIKYTDGVLYVADYLKKKVLGFKI